jgi:uncharacterized membrane protein YbhN (UPF0104 family)
VSRLIRLVVSAGLLGWIAWKSDWAELGQAFGQLRIELWLAAAGLFGLCQVASAVRWQRMAGALGFQRPLGQYISMYFIGTFFNLALPTSVGGDVVRISYLNNGSGRRLAAFMAVLLDRLSGLIVLLALAVLGVAFSPVPLEPWIPWSIWGMTAGAVLGVVMLPLVARWFRLGEVRVEQIKLGLGVLRRPGLLLETTFWSALVQGGNVILVWIIGVALEAPVPASFYWIMVPMVSLLTMLPISVNGMGVREQSAVLLLAPFGVPSAIALTLALLWFASSAANSLIGGVVFLYGGFAKPAAALSSAKEPPDGSLDHHPDQRRTRQPRQAA